MDCPHCKTRNSSGATNCSTCHAPLGAVAATVVGELTPPAAGGAVTIVGDTPTTPPGSASDVTLDGSAPSSMGIPTAWSVPASGQGEEGRQVAFAAIKPGSLLGNRYEIIDILGEGGMGAVYKARDRELDRMVALKVIRPELAGRPEILQRFKQELILARQVTHRNVIRIFDLGEAGGVKFITMEFVEGHDLKTVLARDGKLPPDRAVEIIQQVCLALEAAHSEGVVHRDLKPQNIMLDQQGRALVMDFGIARSLEFGGMTQTGALIGTPEYMSPEQVRGEHVDARSDLFTLGVIFQEILTGKLPFEAETAMASMFKRTKERSVPVRQLDPAVPQYLSDIVTRCLEIEPQDRFQSAREIYDALEAWKSGAAVPIRVGSLRWVRRALRNRSAIGFAAAGAALAVLLIVVVVAFRMYSSRKAAPHAPVSVLVGDFTNKTGDPIFDGTIEPMFNVALEGASFIDAFNRGTAHRVAAKLPHPSSTLDEQTARLVAMNQGVNAVVTGALARRGTGYRFSVQAIDTFTGKLLAKADVNAANKDEILLDVPKLAVPIRKALGDSTPESAQITAMQGAFSIGNLEVVHQYAIGLDQQGAGKIQDAFQSFSKAAELDPNFARAYFALAVLSQNVGKADDAGKYYKMAMSHVDRMTERERYRIRGAYYVYLGDPQKCVEEYHSMLKLYPSDALGHGNLAYCYDQVHDYGAAVSELQLAIKLMPKYVNWQLNLAFAYAHLGDFRKAEAQIKTVLQSSPSFEQAYWVLAFTELAQDREAEAIETYKAVSKLSPLGESLSASGLADVALYDGRFSEAVSLLEGGVRADTAAKNGRVAEKYVVLGESQLQWGHTDPAIAAAKLALKHTQKVNARFLAARVLVEAGDMTTAHAAGKALGAEIGSEAQADSRIIEGDIALKERNPRKAIQLFSEANKIFESWMGHFDLGRAYFDAGLYVEANSEFDRCITGRGKAVDMLDAPTFGFVPPAYYYLARTEQALGSPGAADAYRHFISMESKGKGGALLQDAKERLADLASKQ